MNLTTPEEVQAVLIRSDVVFTPIGDEIMQRIISDPGTFRIHLESEPII